MDLLYSRRKEWPYAENSPKDSVGRWLGTLPLRRIGPVSCWDAIGDARREFTELLKGKIRLYLEQNHEMVQDSGNIIDFSLFMVGRSATRTKPTIMFVSEDKRARKEAFKMIKASDIMKEHPGFELGHIPLAAEFENLRFLAGKDVDLACDAFRPSEPLDVFTPKAGKLEGRRLYFYGTSEPQTIPRTATAGGVISYQGTRMILTVDHFLERTQPAARSIVPLSDDDEDDDDDCEITGHSDIDDESDNDLIDATSRGSATPESVASDMDGSESGGHGASLLASGSTFDAEEYMATVQARLERLDLTQERVTHISGPKDACIRAGKVVQRSKELDYALIEVDPAVGSLCDVGHNIIDLDDDSRVEKDPRDAAVKTTTPGGGTVGGILSGTPSLVRLPHSKTYTEVYVARFDQPLVEGDCGSWVRDAVTGNLFGHVFAGSPTSGLTMVMPACSVFEQVRSCVQDRLEAKSVGIAEGNAERHEDEDGQLHPPNSQSDFRESVPPSPSADTQTLNKLEGGGYFPSLSPYHYRSRSGISSSEGTPENLPEAREPAMIAKYIARRATLLGWFDELPAAAISSGWSATSVAIRQPDGTYTYAPDDPSPNLVAAVARLDENAIISMVSEVTNTVLDAIKPDQNSLLVESTGARIPIIPSLADIHQSLVYSASSCIVVEERCVLIWSNDANTIISVAHNVEKQLLGFIVGPSIPRGLLAQTEEQSIDGQATHVRGAIDEKHEIYQAAIKVEKARTMSTRFSKVTRLRPTLRFRIGIVMILVILTQSMGVSKLLRQWAWDGDYLRFTLVAVIPPLCLLSLFFFIVVVSSVFQLLLPAGMCLRNSKYHYAVKPNRKRYVNYELPHITVQMPVYKEGLRGVVVPTMVSVMAAIQYYENQGGTASVFINDDGMQCIQPELAAARKQYYRENGIGYCARMPNMKTSKSGGFLSWFKRSPPIDPEVDNQDESELSPQGRANRLGFVRKGKFKKASNMNYCLSFSNRVEDELHRLTELECQNRNCSYGDLTAEDDDRMYEMALQNMLDADEGKTWAEGNIRMGEIILIIDCDTRVPVDCLLYGALEMHESAENGITYFTNIVYTAIKHGVGTGDVAPFVGHNAFLRWKAIQSVSFVNPSDGVTKWWSDSHEKYTYGCNELVFHPFYQWTYKGPVTRLFLRFLWSNMPVSSEVSIIAYIFTYYAIAAGMLLTIVNYVLVGLFFADPDHFYTPSWGIWVSLSPSSTASLLSPSA
ncbi:hypothetical protein B0J13DRAFT_680698 [Dactylonectria estremocensis]|uniref:Glycosyltransferase 2-like domain-containing protein n=1 Tax=Dactylonectria estremocensis TaxID=1079267 RepID=A0A9P9DJR4_9HYPO|nr:hypothetical protein B0J13DRAFT_680698 [Dactylonectria estremocensis]